jgi:phosphoribosylformylglycinamidine cyclo-ligase
VTSSDQYSAAGVDLDAADRAKRRIAEAVMTTRTGASVGAVGAFGGMVRLPRGVRNPLLIMSTDGVGTKVLVARLAGRYDTVGEDLVNHCVNDILVHGARPLAFLDYLAGAELPVEAIASVVEGVARGCRAHAMPLAGGETAQMPGLYHAGDFDLAGTIVGVVEEDRAIHGEAVRAGDALLGYASSGLHTNGYTLARRIVFEDLGLDSTSPLGETGQSVAEALLAVHVSYARAVMPVIGQVHGIAHITGGGIVANLARVMPPDCEAVVDSASWELPPLFRILQEAGGVSTDEMRRVFNLGVGLIVALPQDHVPDARAAATQAGVATWIMGEVRRGERAVRFAD